MRAVVGLRALVLCVVCLLSVEAVRAQQRVMWRRGQSIGLRELRRAFPGHEQYWWDDAGFENSPDTREPILGAGRGSGLERECLVRVSMRATSRSSRGATVRGAPRREAFGGEIVLRDPRFVAPQGVRVDASYAAIASSLDRCELHLGDFIGLVCSVGGEPNVSVELTSSTGFAACDADAWRACTADLDAARVSAIVLRAS